MNLLCKSSFCKDSQGAELTCGVQDRLALYNGCSYLLKVGLSQFNSHLQWTVISALLLEHRRPFDKSLRTGTKALFPHERNTFLFFLIIFTVHWLGRPSFSFPSQNCCTPSGSGKGLGQQTATLQSPLARTLAFFCQINPPVQPPVALTFACAQKRPGSHRDTLDITPGACTQTHPRIPIPDLILREHP